MYSPASTLLPPPANRTRPAHRLNDTVCRFGRNETIFSDGEIAEHCYKIVSGTVRLVKLMKDGRRNIASFKLAGDFLGAEPSEQHAYTTEAVTEVVAVRFPHFPTGRCGEEPDESVDRQTTGLIGELREAREHMVTLGCRSATERVAKFLHSFARRNSTRDGEAIELPMGREDMADYLGLTIETVCRSLRRLKDAGVIEIPNRQAIVIVSLAALRAAATSEA